MVKDWNLLPRRVLANCRRKTCRNLSEYVSSEDTVMQMNFSLALPFNIYSARFYLAFNSLTAREKVHAAPLSFRLSSDKPASALDQCLHTRSSCG